jgi:hypothetical protein
MTARMTSARTRTPLLRRLILAAVLTVALSGLMIGRADAAPKGGSSPTVTCPGGGKPGQTATLTTVTKINGKLISIETDKVICGNDGNYF